MGSTGESWALGEEGWAWGKCWGGVSESSCPPHFPCTASPQLVQSPATAENRAEGTSPALALTCPCLGSLCPPRQPGSHSAELIPHGGSQCPRPQQGSGSSPGPSWDVATAHQRPLSPPSVPSMPPSPAQASAVPEQDVAVQRDVMKRALVPRQPLGANCGTELPWHEEGCLLPQRL